MKLESFLIRGNISIKSAMKQMDEVGEKILFIVDEDYKLRGALTDGDIRRWILADGNLGESTEAIFNKNPIYVEEGYEIEDVKRTMISEKITWIPVIDKSGKLGDILLWESIFGEKKKIAPKDLNIQVVVMGGGQGSRLIPFTKILPKPLIPIGEKPIIEIVMDHFAEFGCNDFFLVIGYKAEMIKSYFNNKTNNYKINFIQEEFPQGTAGGLKLLPKEFSENFFVTNCDIIIKADYREIYNFHIKNNCEITIVGSVKHFRIPYGVMEISNGGNLKELIEKPEHDLLVNTGMYVLKREIIDLIPNKSLFHITDLISKIKSRGGKIGVYPISEKSWIDIGQWEEYKKTVEKLQFESVEKPY